MQQNQTPLTLTDLLMRDPEHPDVRKQLMDRYEQVCKERAMLMRLLKLPGMDEKRRIYEQRTQVPS